MSTSPPATQSSNRNGPTWWQIIGSVVIAMVLGALIMPFPGSLASEKAHAATCASNLKALGLGLQQYSNDYDGCFPYGKADGSGQGWAGAIEPYVKAAITKTSNSDAVEDALQAIWACPDDPTGPDRSVDPPGLALSYSMNATLTGNTLLPNCSPKRSRLYAPPQTVMLFETRDAIVQIEAPQEGGAVKPKTGWFSGVGNGMANALQHGGAAANLSAYSRVQYETGDMGGRGCGRAACLPGRHADPRTHIAGALYLAADGHVVWESPEHVSSGNSPKSSGEQKGGLASGTAATTDRLHQPGSRFDITFSAR